MGKKHSGGADADLDVANKVITSNPPKSKSKSQPKVPKFTVKP